MLALFLLMPSGTDASTLPSHCQRLERLLHHMDAPHSHQPLSFLSSPSLSLPQAINGLAHSTSYSTSLTSHHTAAPSSVSSVLDSFQPRRLQRSDFDKGFLTLLSQLTDVGDVSSQLFNERFDELSRVGETQQVWIIEDVGVGRVIATATLLIELKFIHGVSKVSV